MPLIKVKRLSYKGVCDGGAAREDALVNTDEVTSAVKVDARGDGPFLQLLFKNGAMMVIVGDVDAVLAEVNKPIRS